MNYGDLLYRAHENKCSASNQEVRCYKTGFSPPKKLSKSKVSSDNIKKFLARREEEEKKKADEARRKKIELLALRSQDKKAQKRVQVMLKRTKSANKSVMEDAIDNVNTADTLNGPSQCDDDDYGYVSQEASALYNKLINKYENMPPEPSIFSKGKKEVKDLAAAKDRVKIALQKEAEEAESPHRRKKKLKQDTNNDLFKDFISDDEIIEQAEESKSKNEVTCETNKQECSNSSKPKIKKYPATSPPLDFNELLKLAKQKQHEPILIDINTKFKEPERLMTSKEKEEFLREEERKHKRKNRDKFGKSSATPSDNKVPVKELQFEEQSALKKRIPKLSDRNLQKKPKEVEKIQKQEETTNKITSEIKSSKLTCHNESKKNVKPTTNQCTNQLIKKEGNGLTKKLTSNPEKILQNRNFTIQNSSKATPSCSNQKQRSADKPVPQYVPKPKAQIKNVDKELSDIDKEIELLRKRKMLLAMKSQEQAPVPKYIPTAIKPQAKNSKLPQEVKENRIIKKKPLVKKRYLESDSEYDSELDDFIDNGPEEGEDYSKVISEIFGYDKSRFRDFDDDDDFCMESNFAQQMREEFVSTKIGIMEDLEDIRQEQEEKRLKARKKLKASR